MKKPHADGATVKSTFVEDEIGELRKYIVEMMHAEMELMENIKLNERNVTAVNARIKHFKELIAQERVRFKMLKKELVGDTNELKSLEEKQIVSDAKHRQFRDAVAKRESEVHVLRARFQRQRAAMLSLRCQVVDATKCLEKVSSMNESVEKETHRVAAALSECTEPAEQRAARQKFRAKIQYTQQFIAQMEEETSHLVGKRMKLEAEVLKCEQETHKLRELIFVKEKETEVLFNRLREDTLRVIKENGKIEGKLKAKRRKFRLKTKNEISSLKRRITFVTSELERGQMTNEDVLSNVDALSAQREELEQSLSTRNEQLAATESAIAELSASIATINQGGRDFDTTRLQEEISSKHNDARAAQKKLEEKQDLLKLLEADQTQLGATLEDIGTQIVAAKSTAEGLDSEIASLEKDIEEQEAKSASLGVSMADTKKRNDDLQSQYQDHQRKNKTAVKTQAKLRHQKGALLKQEQELALELREAENLSQLLAEGIKHGTEYALRLRDSTEDKEKRVEFELRSLALNLQQQCSREEAEMQKEVAAWDEKIKELEQQQRII